ncbi:hypothetical protein [Kordiimonas aquimaris]|uniref:hypothetical protein n=1 Tax=Kordiimonas aquimaris TaxID=707591 RepID=UPI0021D0380F|nr:hypothetical protein [Kordiimonas aquimaris]
MPNGSSGDSAVKLISFLKTEARLLHREAQQGDVFALKRISDQCPSIQLGTELQRKHCLATIGRELGFDNWKTALDCFSDNEEATYGAFLHPRRCHVHWNIWFADYTEAKQVRSEHGGYLLPYKQQYMIVDRDYITSLGLEPDAEAWESLGRDWLAKAGDHARSALALQIANTHLNWFKERSYQQHDGKQ